MTTARHRNRDWVFPTTSSGSPETWQHIEIAVLMDIRDEMQKLNRVLACPNFLSIPRVLAEIRRNTAKPRKRKSAEKRSGK